MKKIFAVLIAMLLTCLSGCSLSSDNALTQEDVNDLLAGDAAQPPEASSSALTIMYYGVCDDLELMVAEFEKERSLDSNLLHYEREDVGKVETKLMAGDSDVDLFYSSSVNVSAVVRVGAFADMYTFPQLKERIESDEFAKFVSTYDGKCFGVPLQCVYGSKDLSINPSMSVFPSYSEEAMAWYNHGNLMAKYSSYEINAVKEEYYDLDGEKLYEIFRWLYDNPDDPFENPVYPEEYKTADSEYLIMNTESRNKELAAEFCAYVFDRMSGAEESGITHYYPKLEGYENVTASWNRYDSLILPTVSDITATDGSEESLRKLAEETAREIRKHIQG